MLTREKIAQSNNQPDALHTGVMCSISTDRSGSSAFLA
jgi:hypothetical protein